jgi:hypothetical protein
MIRRRGFGQIAVLLAAVALLSLAGAAGCRKAAPSGKAEFPSFVYANAQTLDGFRAAVALKADLEYLPCFCGCVTSPGHKSLRQCFITDEGDYDRHAAGCDICVREVLDVARLKKDGKGLAEIRAFIEERYSRYGPGTDTQPVPAGTGAFQ